jgi:hypothetical protein
MNSQYTCCVAVSERWISVAAKTYTGAPRKEIAAKIVEPRSKLPPLTAARWLYNSKK